MMDGNYQEQKEVIGNLNIQRKKELLQLVENLPVR